MLRILVIAAVAVLLTEQPLAAEPVSVLDADGKAWVMQIEPQVAQAAQAIPLPSPAFEETEPAEVTANKPVAEEAAAPPAPMPEVIPAAPISAYGMTVSPQGCMPQASVERLYRQIYASIPFNRAEYVANPSYRHDATMELITGNVQPGGGKTGRILHSREYTGYRPYIPAKYDYYRYRYPVGYGLYGFNRLPFAGVGFTSSGFGYTY